MNRITFYKEDKDKINDVLNTDTTSGVIFDKEAELQKALDDFAKRPDACTLPVFKQVQTLVAKVLGANQSDRQLDNMEYFLNRRHEIHGQQYPKGSEPIRKSERRDK